MNTHAPHPRQALFLVFSLMLAVAPRFASGQEGSARPGFYTALELGGSSLDLDAVVDQRLSDLPFALSQDGGGAELAIGYSFGRSFGLELVLGGRDLAADLDGASATLGEVLLEARAPLRTHGRVVPYLSGHLGGMALEVSGNGFADRTLSGAVSGIGAGTEIHLSRRWAMDFGYRFSLIDFENETLDTIDGEREIDLDGAGRVHRWGMRMVYSF